MIGQKNLLAIACVVLAGTLSACSSFAPVYGTNTTRSDGTALRFNFAPPDSRIEQVIIDRLKVAFPGSASPQDPVLDISAGVGGLPGPISNAVSVARPANFRVVATVTVAQGDQTIFTATRFSDTAYQGGKLTPTDLESARGSEEAAARSVAESLRAAILAGYSVAMPVTPR